MNSSPRHWSDLRQMLAPLPIIMAAALAVVALLAVGLLWHAVSPDASTEGSSPNPPAAAAPAGEETDQASAPEDPMQQQFAELRRRMVERQLKRRGVDDERVLDVMGRVPRHEFVPPRFRRMAYSDGPLPIGHEQTISQPLIVAMMTQLARPKRDSRVLDVGTGSGYQAAVLGELVDRVYSIEILEPLANESRERLKRMGYKNVEVRCGDGYRGWPQHSPFDAIIVAAAPDHVPRPLTDQLAVGGRLIIPVGEGIRQHLLVVEKQPDGSLRREKVAAVAFVPMTGEAEGGTLQENR